MIRRFGVAVLSVAVLVASAAAGEFNGKFAGSKKLPRDWTVEKSAEVSAAKLKSASDKLKKQGISDQDLDRLRKTMADADLIYCNHDADFADNINIRATPRFPGLNLPTTAVEMEQYARIMSLALNKQLGINGKIQGMARVNVDGKPALRYQFPGVVRGTVSIQYVVEAKTRLVFITLTTKDKTLLKYRPQFNTFVSSLEIK